MTILASFCLITFLTGVGAVGIAAEGVLMPAPFLNFLLELKYV
jgi:hypothetical protein